MHVCLLMCAGVFATNLLAQDASPPVSKPKPGQKHTTVDTQVRSLLDDAEALPPEFTSDVILQLVENGLVPDDHLKIKLLNDASEKASLAQDEYPERPWGVNVEETPLGLHAIASITTGLNRLSLQARVVRLAISTNPQQARQLFESIYPPRIQPLPCNESWFPWSEPYYNTLTILLDKGFSPREIAGGLRGSYAASIIKNIKSHLELVFAVQLLETGSFTDQELQELVPAYVSSLLNLDGDPKSFEMVMSDARLFDGVSKLISLSAKHGIDSRSVLQAMHDYLVGNFNEPHCSTFAASRGSDLPDAIVRFNDTFGPQLIRANLSTIGADELREDDSLPIDPSPPRWKSKTYLDLLATLQTLTPPPNPSDNTKTSATLDAFLTKAQDLLTKLGAWSENSEPETEFFHQKAILLEGLAERTEGTSLHKEVLDRFIMFLQEFPPDQIGTVDWYLYVKKLLRANMKANYTRDNLRAFLDSREPVLTVYARLELLLQAAKYAPVGTHTSQNANKSDHK